MPSISAVARPCYDKTQSRWVCRWKEDGKARAKAIWREHQRAEAEAFRAELLKLQGSHAPAESRAHTAADIAALIASNDGSASWWGRGSSLLGSMMLSAVEAGDVARLDMLRKAAEPWARLAASAAQHRDTRELEATYERLKKRFEALTKAEKHGAGVGAVEELAQSGKPLVRRDEQVH